MKKKWLHAIRRDEGKHFKVTEYSKICSRHFREGDIKKSFAGKNELRDGVVVESKSASQTLPSPAVVEEL